MMIPNFHLLAIRSSREPVLHDHGSHLLYLVRLRITSHGLQVQNLLHSSLGEDVVAAANSLIQSKMAEQTTETVERDVRIRSAAQEFGEKAIAFNHSQSLPEELCKSEQFNSGRKLS
jgi:hypothetical protein